MTAPALPIPAQVLDLRAWKWTAPYPNPAKGSDPTKPFERKPPDLAKWPGDAFFKAVRDTAQAVGLQFSAPVVGPTTPGSFNVRSELREMDAKDPTKGASWSSTSGANALVQDMAFTRYPTGDPQCGVVGGQIHDADDDVAAWRFESTGLWLALGDHRSDWRLVDPRYKGGRIATAFTVADGQVECWYQGRSVWRFPARFSGAYFKAGAYTQANAGPVPRDKSNYGAAIYYGLTVVHGATLPNIPGPVTIPAPPPEVPRPTLPCPHCGNPVTLARP